MVDYSLHLILFFFFRCI